MPGAVFSPDVETYGSLKELFSDEHKYQEHVQNSLSNFIRKADADEVEFDGKTWKVAVDLQLNESYASINDGEPLPDSDVIKSVFAQFNPKLSYAPMEATQFAMTRGHNQGRVGGKYFDSLAKSTLLAMLSGVDFDLYANGRGYRAEVDAATPAALNFTVISSMRVRPGMKFSWVDSTYTTIRGSIKVDIKSVNRIDRIVYIDPTFGTGAVPTGAVSGDKLVVYGALAAGEPVDGRYVAGLSRITDNSLSYGGLSPAQYAAWQTVNQNAGGGNITQMMLQTQFDLMYQISGMYPNKLVLPTSQKRSYLSGFLNQRQFTSNNFDTGANTLTFDPVKMGKDEKNKKPGNFEILEDKNADVDTIYAWHDSCLCYATDYTDEPALADEDGSEMRFRHGYDSMNGFYRYWWNTVSGQRNGIGKIYNLAKPSGTI